MVGSYHSHQNPYIQCEGDACISAADIYHFTQLLKSNYLVSFEMILPTMASPELCESPEI